MTDFARWLSTSPRTVDILLADCVATFGGSEAWATSMVPLIGTGIAVPGERVALPGIFEDSYTEVLGDVEARQITLDVEAIATRSDGEHGELIVHGTRVLIEPYYPLYGVPPFIFEVQRSETDGKGRALHQLHVLGPSCAHITGTGFPYTFPIVFGSYSFDVCVDL